MPESSTVYVPERTRPGSRIFHQVVQGALSPAKRPNWLSFDTKAREWNLHFPNGRFARIAEKDLTRSYSRVWYAVVNDAHIILPRRLTMPQWLLILGPYLADFYFGPDPEDLRPYHPEESLS